MLGLWKANNTFHLFLVRLVMPFIRIKDFKNLILEQIKHIKGKEQVFTNDVQKVKALEQKERAMYEQLLLISELKRI